MEIVWVAPSLRGTTLALLNHRLIPWKFGESTVGLWYLMPLLFIKKNNLNARCIIEWMCFKKCRWVLCNMYRWKIVFSVEESFQDFVLLSCWFIWTSWCRLLWCVFSFWIHQFFCASSFMCWSIILSHLDLSVCSSSINSSHQWS